MTPQLLKKLSAAQAIERTRKSMNEPTLKAAQKIIDEVRRHGRPALIKFGEKFGDLNPGEPLIYDRPKLEAALARLPDDQQNLLKRTAQRIEFFAKAQRACLRDLSLPIEGGMAGWRFFPVSRAGCYAPAGRFPLPSSILMTTVTARAAGVAEVWVASPRPEDLTLAAAAVGGAEALVAAGGAQAIAAMAYGVDGVPRCDVIVGPGNKYVTAAKQLVTGQVGIDMLAGPSELLILADESADPTLIATDLLAQAEHDPDAVPLLVTTCVELASLVNQELSSQLKNLSTAPIAQQALTNGGWIETLDLAEAVETCNRLAPEHLEVMLANPETVNSRLTKYGAIFLGSGTAEVLGDYGAGPNHVLPTGGTARFSGGLSVQDFLIGRTWLEMSGDDTATSVTQDAVALAQLEGLQGHARSAAKRLADNQ